MTSPCCMLVAQVVAAQHLLVARFAPCNGALLIRATKTLNPLSVLANRLLHEHATLDFVADPCNTSVAGPLHRGVA